VRTDVQNTSSQSSLLYQFSEMTSIKENEQINLIKELITYRTINENVSDWAIKSFSVKH